MFCFENIQMVARNGVLKSGRCWSSLLFLYTAEHCTASTSTWFPRSHRTWSSRVRLCILHTSSSDMVLPVWWIVLECALQRLSDTLDLLKEVHCATRCMILNSKVCVKLHWLKSINVLEKHLSRKQQIRWYKIYIFIHWPQNGKSLTEYMIHAINCFIKMFYKIHECDTPQHIPCTCDQNIWRRNQGNFPYLKRNKYSMLAKGPIF